jgi:hypothetical protein
MSMSGRLLFGALAGVAALLVLMPASGASRSTCEPNLAIEAPKPGAAVEDPLLVRYRITCLAVREDRPAYLRVVLPQMDPAIRAVKRLTTKTGSASVAFSKLETGQRDLRFTLLRANRSIADSVLVRDVLLTGGR